MRPDGSYYDNSVYPGQSFLYRSFESEGKLQFGHKRTLFIILVIFILMKIAIYLFKVAMYIIRGKERLMTAFRCDPFNDATLFMCGARRYGNGNGIKTFDLIGKWHIILYKIP